MARGKIYTGITLEDDLLKIARIRVNGKKVTLVNLDQVRLVEKLQRAEVKAEVNEQVFDDMDMDMDLDIDDAIDETIFGIDDALDEGTSEDIDDLGVDLGLESPDDDLDLDLDFENLEEDEDMADMDMADEADVPSSNELLLYNVLSAIDPKRVDLGLGIPSGNTIYQILRDVDFNDTKSKDLQVIIEDRLEAFHGVVKSEDFYSYSIREDGSMLLASLDDEPSLIGLVNRTQDLYSGKAFISDVVPEEMVVLGLINTNYDLSPDSITGVIQFGVDQSRVLFLKGNNLWIVSPIISEGVNSKKVLNTIFSKILFQLDTGEVPNLDKIIICNNSIGDAAIEFFEDRFTDVDVSEFRFSDDLFDTEITSERSIAAYTTTIGAAWSASAVNKKEFPGISFIPKYVKDKQKIFKLQWHGFMLLLLIFLTPFAFNYFYTANVSEINSLENEIRSLNQQITELEPTVQEYNRISAEMTSIQGNLALLDTLSKGTLKWSKNLDLLNNGSDQINNIWITSISSDEEGIIELTGIATSRERIAELADLFENSTLTDVSAEEIREREVYNFRYLIRRVFEDENEYNPESTQGIQDVMGN
ncbi:PilN domain-containing protein [Balneola sp. MJW-20]|uniref:PilN domain-containing protein n=1 Tax=Gracilimonas aurantiaca TaxID=3234185 RepID=UPI0034673E33